MIHVPYAYAIVPKLDKTVGFGVVQLDPSATGFSQSTGLK